MTKERRLGRGLEALLGTPITAAPDHGDANPNNSSGSGEGLSRLSIYQIDGNPFQPRREFDDAEIRALAESLVEHGLLQPIVVRRLEDRFQLVAGERRLRAAIKAGWTEVPAQVVEADDQQVAELAIVENLQRKDLNALEKATSFQQYIERYGCTQEELAGRLKIDRSTVSNLIRLLELPEAVQKSLRGGSISQGHARALLPLGDEPEQIAFCKRIQSEGLSVRATERQVQEMIAQADAEPLAVVDGEGRKARGGGNRSEHILHLEQQLRTSLGTKVDLHTTRSGRGRIVVHFSNHDEFERLEQLLCPHGEQNPQRNVG